MKTASKWLTVLVVFAVVFGAAAPQASAKKLSAAAIFFEINATDGDAGIQIFLDGDGWDRMKVFNPDGKKILDVKGKGGIGQQGITELFFESAEPSFEEQSLEELLALFPEGQYKFKGTQTNGKSLTGKARLTHDLPMAPNLIRPADGDDSVNPNNTVVEWQLVADPPGSEIIGYHVVVETEDPRLLIFAADVGPDTTSIEVPSEFMNGGGPEYKYEVLAIERSGNQTISEAEFETD